MKEKDFSDEIYAGTQENGPTSRRVKKIIGALLVSAALLVTFDKLWPTVDQAIENKVTDEFFTRDYPLE